MVSIVYSKENATINIHLRRLNSNKIFVGLSDNYEEAKKVKQGDVITVKHLGANIHGTLQFPKFYRARTDVKWENLIKT